MLSTSCRRCKFALREPPCTYYFEDLYALTNNGTFVENPTRIQSKKCTFCGHSATNHIFDRVKKIFYQKNASVQF
jgi:hypothetical protein